MLSLLTSCSTAPQPQPQPLLRAQVIKQPAKKSNKAISSRTAQELYLHGMNFYYRGLYKPAIERFNYATDADDKFLAPYMALGEIYCLIQQPDMAENSYKQALRLDPSLVEARARLGMVYCEQKQYDLAYEHLTAALELQPNHSKAKDYLKYTKQKLARQHLAEGIAYRNGADLGQARISFQEAVRNDPQLGEAYFELGKIYMSEQQYHPAIDSLKLALEIMPKTSTAWRYLGQSLLGLYEYEKARKALQRCLLINPHDEEGEKLLKLVQQELYRGKSIPGEFLKISSNPSITRGELAALLALNLKLPLGKSLPRLDVPVVIPDISSHWAREYIIYVVRNKLMREYPNHYFLPEASLSRGEAAEIVDSALQQLTGLKAIEGKSEGWSYEDVTPLHQYYGAVTRLAALGIMTPQAENSFGVTHKLSGLEALEIVDRLADFLAE